MKLKEKHPIIDAFKEFFESDIPKVSGKRLAWDLLNDHQIVTRALHYPV